MKLLGVCQQTDTIKIIQQSVLNALMAAQYAKTYNYALTVLMDIF